VFRQKFVGAPSRQTPLPDPLRVAELHSFRGMLDGLDEVRTRLRGAAMPPDDKIMRRHRDMPDVLGRLGSCDAKLAASAAALRAEAMAITPADLAGMPARIEPRLIQLQALLHERGELLNVA
jgi:hypothetical protein